MYHSPMAIRGQRASRWTLVTYVMPADTRHTFDASPQLQGLPRFNFVLYTYSQGWHTHSARPSAPTRGWNRRTQDPPQRRHRSTALTQASPAQRPSSATGRASTIVFLQKQTATNPSFTCPGTTYGRRINRASPDYQGSPVSATPTYNPTNTPGVGVNTFGVYGNDAT